MTKWRTVFKNGARKFLRCAIGARKIQTRIIPARTIDSVMAKATTISYEVDELSVLRGMSHGAACDQLALGIGNI